MLLADVYMYVGSVGVNVDEREHEHEVSMSASNLASQRLGRGSFQK